MNLSEKLVHFIKEYRPYILVFTLAFGLRLGFFFLVKPYGPGGDDKLLIDDASGYHSIAVSLLKDGSFPPDNDYQSMLRTIGYPAFIAGIYFVFGNHPWVVILFQMLLDSLLALLLIRFALLFRLNKLSILTGVLWAIDPFGIIFSNALLSDSMFVFFIVLAFFYLARFLIQDSKTDLYLNSIFLAIAAHIRPVALYLIVLLAVIFLFKFIKEKKLNEWLHYALIFFLFIAPWIARNKIIHGHFFFSISGDYNALILYASPVYAAQNNLEYDEAKRILEKQMEERFENLIKTDPFLFYQKYKERGLEIISSDPTMFVKQSLKNGIVMMFGMQLTTFKRLNLISAQSPKLNESIQKSGLVQTIKEFINHFNMYTLIYMVLVSGLFIFEYLFSFYGGIKCFKDEMDMQILIVLFLLPIFYFFLIGVPIGITRLKLTFNPFIMLLATYGIAQVIKTNSTIIKSKSTI